MSEVFFQSLSAQQWRNVAEYLNHCLPICPTDSNTHEAITELVHTVNLFCPDEPETEAAEPNDITQYIGAGGGR